MVRTLVIAALLAGAGCGQSGTAKPHDAVKATASPASLSVKVVVVTPTKGLEHYPCEQCHRHIEKGAGTVSNSHAAIRLKHMPKAECKTCHDVELPGQLRLASGMVLALEDVLQLCGQCHSTQVADWQVGIHGKQVGNWQRELHRYGCTKCHDPHHPNFGTMLAVPAPPFPRLGIPKGEH